MAETVKLPAIGEVKKTYVYAGGALVLGIVGYAYWARAQAGSSTPTTAVDPTNTGLAGDGYTNPAPNDPDYYDDPEAAPRTNTEWTSRALDALGNIGIELTYASSVLGKYLNRTPITITEADVVRQAWALLGKPPEGPTTYILVTSPNPDPDPDPDPDPPPAAKVPAAPTGVKVLSPSPTQMTIGWNPVSGATAYQVALVSRALYYDWTTNLNVHRGYTIRDLKPGLDVKIQVRAKNAAGVGPWSAPLNTRTPK